MYIDTSPTDIRCQGSSIFFWLPLESSHIFGRSSSQIFLDFGCWMPSSFVAYYHDLFLSFHTSFSRASNHSSMIVVNFLIIHIILCWFHLVWLVLCCNISEGEILSSLDHISQDGNSDPYYLQPYDMTLIIIYASIHTSSFFRLSKLPISAPFERIFILLSCYVIIPSFIESHELRFLMKTFASFLHWWSEKLNNISYPHPADVFFYDDPRWWWSLLP